MPEPHKHAEKRNWVESILRKIPGFRGYLEKEYRRESDHLTRTWIADRLQGSKQSLDNYLRGLLDAGQIDALPQLERVRSRLDATTTKVRGQVRGYSGFFDFVKVDERLLDEVYLHDLELVEDADHLAQSIEQLSVKGDTPQAVVTDLIARLDAFDAKVVQRGQILQGVSDAAGP